MRVCLAREVLYRYEHNLAKQSEGSRNAMQEAVEGSLELMKERVNGFGGVIAVGSRSQDIGIAFNTKGMPWAYISSEDLDADFIARLKGGDSSCKIKIHYGYNPGDHDLVALQ